MKFGQSYCNNIWLCQINQKLSIDRVYNSTNSLGFVLRCQRYFHLTCTASFWYPRVMNLKDQLESVKYLHNQNDLASRFNLCSDKRRASYKRQCPAQSLSIYQGSRSRLQLIAKFYSICWTLQLVAGVLPMRQDWQIIIRFKETS